MFITPGATPADATLTRAAATEVARNWGLLLLNGVAADRLGLPDLQHRLDDPRAGDLHRLLFIFQGLTTALTTGLGDRIRQTNVITGLLSIVTGVVIIAWPGPGLVAVAIFLGAWLIVSGTLAISGAFSLRQVLPGWWLLLIMGLLEVPLGALALADPGATLAALVTVAGIWAVAIGVMRVVLAFEVKRLP